MACKQKSEPFSRLGYIRFGGANGDRTRDLLVANEALSQLSYSPKPFLPRPRPGVKAPYVESAPLTVKLIHQNTARAECGRCGNLAHFRPGWQNRCRCPGRGANDTKEHALINPILWLVLKILDIYVWVVIAAVVLSWLVAFNVVNLYNNFVRSIAKVLDVLTEPVFRIVRRVLPPIAGLDLSPIVVLFGIWFLQYCLVWAYNTFYLRLMPY